LDKPLIDLSRITGDTLDQLTRAGRVEPLPPGPRSTGEVIPDPAATPGNEQEKGCGRHLPQGSDPSPGIVLEAAPEHFFDQERWNEFVSCCGSREEALRRIGRPDPSLLVWYRHQVAEQQTSDSTRAREAERIYRLGQSLVQAFRARLISGEYVATGFQPPSIERVRIPAELHSEPVFDFETGAEKGDGYTFTHVWILTAVHLAGKALEISERIAAWLIVRRARHGEELKKALLHAAQTEFGGDCTGRAFDAAYRRIYTRKRGRPPISSGD
jgi:hypothetical protein